MLRTLTTEINFGISELVQKMAFNQYLSLIMTSWPVVRVGQKGRFGRCYSGC